MHAPSNFSIFTYSLNSITMSQKIITLATLTQMRAQLLAAMLERNQVECFMTNMNRMKEAPGGVKVKIYESDAAKAMKIFDDFRSSYGKDKQEAVDHMKAIRRILVPVDFTVHAENAARYALYVASILKSEIKLVNAYLDPTGTPQTYLESYSYQVNIDKVIREIEEETYKSLFAMTERLEKEAEERQFKGLKIRFDLFKGNSSDVILHEVDEYQPKPRCDGYKGQRAGGIQVIRQCYRPYD